MGIRIFRENSYEKLLERALSGSVDAVLLQTLSVASVLNRTGQEDRVAISRQSVGSVPLGLALSKLRFTHENLAAVNRHIREFRGSARWQKLLANYRVEARPKDYPLMRRCKD